MVVDFWVTFDQIFILFAIVLIGAVVVKCKVVSDNFRKDVSDFLMAVSIPCTIFNSMLVEFSPDVAKDVVQLVVICGGLMVCEWLLGWAMVRMLHITDPKQVAVYRAAVLFCNSGFMGWPVCAALFGDRGVFYAVAFNIPFNGLFYLLNSIIYANVSGIREKFNWKSQLTMMNVATIAGLIVFLFSIPVPETIGEITSLLGSTTTPLAMAVAGMLLGSSRMMDCVKNAKAFVYSLFRLLIIPLALMVGLRAVGISGLTLAVAVIVTGMPAAANVPVVAEKYGADSYLGAQLVFISTMLSMITIPIIATLVG